jgi:hypothetical protein
LQNKPLVIDNLDRWSSTKEFKMDNTHLYIDGPFQLRFTNQINEGGLNYLIRAWDNNGPIGLPFTPYQNEEVIFNERAQVSFNMETSDTSSLILKSFDWSGGSQSGVEFSYKFYQGGINFPIVTSEPSAEDGSIAFSDGLYWDPSNTGQPNLNIRINGNWEQINLGSGVTGPSGPNGPQGVTGPGYEITNPGTNYMVISDGSPGGISGQSNVTFDGTTFSITGDLKIFGTIDQPNIKSPSIDNAIMNFAYFQGDTTLQNITTILVDSLIVNQAVMDFDFNLGSVFYTQNPGNDFTINVKNLTTTDSRAINITVFVNQGLTTFGVVGFEIEGISQTIKWIGATPPTVLPNTVTAYTFNLIRSGGLWVEVLGAAGIYG